MGYVGNQTTNSYTSMDKQTITGNGGTSYTLDHAVANVNEIEVFVNNVRQEPSVAYTVAGTALTMTGNVASSDDFYVVFQGKALQTVVPPDGSVTTAKLASGAVTDAKIDTMAASKLTGTIDSARMPSFIGFRTKGTSYTQNTGSFSTILGMSEEFDIGGNFNNATGVFTAPEDGYYCFSFWGLSYPHGVGDVNQVRFIVNGSEAGQHVQFNGKTNNHQAVSGSILLNLTANDTVAHQYFRSGGTAYAYGSQWNFQGYKVG